MKQGGGLSFTGPVNRAEVAGPGGEQEVQRERARHGAEEAAPRQRQSPERCRLLQSEEHATHRRAEGRCNSRGAAGAHKVALRGVVAEALPEPRMPNTGVRE